MQEHDKDRPERQRSVSFDPTINLGHVLTFISLVIAGFAAWGSLNTRITVLEESRNAQLAKDASQDTIIKERIAEVLQAVMRIDDRLERLQQQQQQRQMFGKP